ncbi:MAG: hypothetical protein KY469_21075 [Actinobacteria bacterium]|nr:hypothetical protein [Actinomycetota bacterium]
MDTQRISASTIAGIVGGLAFGALLHTQGMIGMIAGLVGGEGPALGWVVHLVISAIIGAGFGLTLARAVSGWGSGLGSGVVYGAIWWVLGPLLIMPIWMGMPTFQINEQAVTSLIGHLLFGFVLGAVYVGASELASEELVPDRTRTA